MGKYSGAFVAFGVAKAKHAIAVAEAGRTGEVRFLGEVENSPARIERTIKKLAPDTADCRSASKRVRRVCIGRSRSSATIAWWSRRR